MSSLPSHCCGLALVSDFTGMPANTEIFYIIFHLKFQKYLIGLSGFILYSVVFIAHYPEHIQPNFLYIDKYLIVPKV